MALDCVTTVFGLVGRGGGLAPNGGRNGGGWRDGPLLLLEPVKRNGCSVEGSADRENSISKEICRKRTCRKRIGEG